MPIYEFYCRKCHTVYRFFSRRVDTEKIPACPICGNVKLKREVSLFSTISSSLKDESSDADLQGLDEAKLEKAMTMLGEEAQGLSEDDPRQAAMLMRKLSDATGITMGPAMDEALRRLERGEDPDKIEEEIGDLFDEEEPFIFGPQGKIRARRERPKVDETLYEL